MREATVACYVSYNKPGMLQSTGSQRVRHSLVTEQQQGTEKEFDYEILKYVLATNTCFP